MPGGHANKNKKPGGGANRGASSAGRRRTHSAASSGGHADAPAASGLSNAHGDAHGEASEVQRTNPDVNLYVRRYIFVIYSDEPPEVHDEDKNVRYYICQKERTPATGKFHWQGYIELYKKRRLISTKINVFRRKDVHLEMAFASQKDNIEYCSKKEDDGNPKWKVDPPKGWKGKGGRVEETSPMTFGTPCSEGQGSVSNMDMVTEMVRTGKSLEEIEDAHPRLVLLHRDAIVASINAYTDRHIPEFRNIYVEIRWGAPGTGKTFGAMGMYRQECYRWRGTKWWDGYKKERVLLIDEFDGNNLAIDECKQICDVYRYHGEVKRSFVQANWRHVIFCSNKHPNDWWKDSKGNSLVSDIDRKAFLDRVNFIKEYTGVSMRQTRTPPVPEPMLRGKYEYPDFFNIQMHYDTDTNSNTFVSSLPNESQNTATLILPQTTSDETTEQQQQQQSPQQKSLEGNISENTNMILTGTQLTTAEETEV